MSGCIVIVDVAHADLIVYDNGAGAFGDLDFATQSDVDGCSRIEADDVRLGSTRTITGIEWTGIYSLSNTPAMTDDFAVAIYSDSGGPVSLASGGLLYSQNIGNNVMRTDTGINAGPRDLYSFSADLDGFTMNGGTTYWLTIYNDTTADIDDNFFWMGVTGGNSYQGTVSGESWIARSKRTDFRLFSAVPEPSSFFLVGCLGVIVCIRRWRNALNLPNRSRQ